MNVIEKTREILTGFPNIAEICHAIHVDFTDPNPDSYGLSSTGDTLISEDICGNQTRQHSFILYTVYSGINDYERLHNSSALLELSCWLGGQIGCEIIGTIDGIECTGEITGIRAENGMLYAAPEENYMDAVQYQLQIIAEYKLNSPI